VPILSEHVSFEMCYHILLCSAATEVGFDKWQ